MVKRVALLTHVQLGKAISVWSDIGPAHFATQRSVGYLVVEAVVDHPNTIDAIVWNFFQVEHAKGRADQTGACALRVIRDVALNTKDGLQGVDAMISCLNELSPRQLSMRVPSLDDSRQFDVKGLSFFKDCTAHRAHHQWQLKADQKGRRTGVSFVVQSRRLSNVGEWTEQTMRMSEDT